ncbi:ComEC/Rec2-related protein [Halothece sp. PCC 7418]|uniref:ComEC/Rec2 family competence protein n=1 Tax=Halothece sp. (strain PCC 7418) TaxID=65093 RepID=UPI0002A086A5|nr:ComEC/Rec2 family competence protein [Halothece sp. PCC 7418]AFZ44151.1 ComEC/Rec2-related protein [Halothece sp. PCC 7418]
MSAKDVPLFCCTYIVGLLIASGFEQYWLTITLTLILGGVILLRVAPIYHWWGFKLRSAWGIIFITLLAFLSFHLRFPTTAENEISQIIPPDKNGTVVTVTGKILDAPTFNQSGKLRFWLSVKGVKDDRRKYQGKLYTTVPAQLETQLNPTATIEVTGYLYQPSPPDNPGQFDFKNYLQKNGAFAGISGREVTVIENQNWGFWQLRERIIQVHLDALGSPQGELVSSMVLGRKAVNLPYHLQDQFLKAGLAHFLAASGFHVSLLLGVVLGITRHLKVSLRFGIGLAILILYVGLTGLQPSILRASLMGVAGLLGLLTERKVNATRSLLVIATILLLINPLWIQDLGFQFSFLATFGLIVTLPPLLEKWDFLPPTLASLIAVPIAIFPWIFPLQLFNFGTVATYSILLNVIATPFAILVIIGGMLSGFMGLIMPSLGSAIALLLSPFTHILIGLVSWFNQLPGSYLLFGKIDLWQLIAVYGLMIFVWQFPQGKPLWKLVTIGAIALIILPITYQKLALQQITIFSTDEPAVILIQNRGHVSLINCGNENTIRYTLLPFLQEQGIQTINSAIALSPNNQWSALNNLVTLNRLFYSRILENEIQNISDLKTTLKQGIGVNNTLVDQQRLNIKQPNPGLLTLIFGEQQWGFLQRPENRLPTVSSEIRKTDVLLWEGNEINRSWFQQLNLKSAIAIANQIPDDLKQEITKEGIDFYFTGKNGAIQWTPRRGLDPMLD